MFLQEPVLFNDSLRMNIDPTQQYEDSQIWKVLEQVRPIFHNIYVAGKANISL